ncbi:MAG TPA: tyrosine--tRNA ligase [Chloroflexota bacterium]
MENVFDMLQERGFVYQCTDEAALRKRLEQPLTLYWGFDATADSLHVGNLVSIMMMAWFPRYGHHPIALAGGGTTLIGDPTGKTSSRPMLSEEDINRNIASIQRQLAHFFDFGDGTARLLNNADWLTKLGFVEFMRDIGSRFSVNEILRLEAYRARLEAGGLSFLEFTYVLMQSYDFLYLYQHYNCILQIGGSDQWGNSVTGADLIRRVTGGEAFVLSHPLITTSSGSKMGKSESGAVWLDPEKTSPYDYYQYWRNTDDADVEQRLAIYTFLPMDEVRQLGALEGADLNRAKEILAFEATSLMHGEHEAEKAQAAARALFTGGGSSDDVPSVEIDRSRLAGGMPVTELFKEAGLVESANEARRLIKQNGLAVDGVKITDPHATIDLSDVENSHLLLQAGRKRFMRVVLR